MLVMTKWIPRLLMIVALAIQTNQSTHGDLVTESYADKSGENIEFVDIDEVDISTSTVTELFFGDPEAVGDGLSFDAFGFRQLAFGGNVEFLSGQIKLDVVGLNGATFDSIHLAEGGAFNLFGSSSSAQVTGNAMVQTDDGTFGTSYSHAMNNPGSGSWTGQVSIQFPETGKATLIFSQQQQSVSDPQQGIAFLETSFLNVGVGLAAVAVPEPGSAILVALCGCSSCLVRRRSS